MGHACQLSKSNLLLIIRQDITQKYLKDLTFTYIYTVCGTYNSAAFVLSNTTGMPERYF